MVSNLFSFARMTAFKDKWKFWTYTSWECFLGNIEVILSVNCKTHKIISLLNFLIKWEWLDEPKSKPEGQAGKLMQLDIFLVQAKQLQIHNLPVMHLEPSFPSLDEWDQLLPPADNVIKSTKIIITKEKSGWLIITLIRNRYSSICKPKGKC